MSDTERHPHPASIRRPEKGDAEGREFAEALIDTVREGLLVLTPELCVLSANRSFYEMFEVDPLETEGRRVYELGNGQWNIPELRRLLEEVLPENDVLQGFEVTHTFEDIGKRTMLLNARCLDGQRLILLAVEDTTERTRAEEALRELNETLERRVEARTAELARSETRFSQAFHAGPVACCLTTSDEDRFLEVNAAFLALTGYTRDEVLGRTAGELGMWSSGEDQQKLKGQGESFHDLELSLQTKGGEARTVLLSCETVQLNGTRARLKQFYDITTRKRSEEELMRAIQQVMQDTTWFSRQVMERLAQLRLGKVEGAEVAELTPRERQVLELIAQGKNNDEIGAELGVAKQTVRNYTTTVYDKIGVRTRAEAVVWARKRGLVGL